MNIRLAGIVKESIVDGDGIRFVVFTQGCLRHCVGCHNPETHDFRGGKDYEISELVSMMKENPLISGLTISGGEPFNQTEACIELAKEAHKLGLNVWCYTGYQFDEVIHNPFLKEIDVLVDGEFRIEEKSLNLKFRGSTNQRIIDVKESFKQHRTVWYDSVYKSI